MSECERIIERSNEERYLNEPQNDVPECDYCGITGEELYDSGRGSYCIECLIEKCVIKGCDIRNIDCVCEFLDTYKDEFIKFVKEWYS